MQALVQLLLNVVTLFTESSCWKGCIRVIIVRFVELISPWTQSINCIETTLQKNENYRSEKDIDREEKRNIEAEPEPLLDTLIQVDSETNKQDNLIRKVGLCYNFETSFRWRSEVVILLIVLVFVAMALFLSFGKIMKLFSSANQKS